MMYLTAFQTRELDVIKKYQAKWYPKEYPTVSLIKPATGSGTRVSLPVGSSVSSSFVPGISRGRERARSDQLNGVTMGKGPRVNRKGFLITLDIITRIRERGNLFDSRSTFQIADTLAASVIYT